jgi:hypothetical protein
MIRTLLAGLAAATPTPPPDFDPDTVTPGWIGFTAMFLVAAATVLLIMDMVRRIRRARYRGEIQERLEAERAASGSSAADEAEPRPEPGD